ncbi:MAG: ATP-binding protein, partial [Candidatus Micrarchaeia archaeon]
STTEFSFVVNNSKVRKGHYVQIEAEDGLLIGFVTDITRANRYFERAESVAEYERGGEPLLKNFPTTEWEYTVADVRILGTYREENLFRNAFPPAPGSKVSLADENILTRILGFDPAGLFIGEVEHHKIDVKLNLNRLLQKHFAILAMSGAGKSYLASVIIEELLDRTPEQGRVAVIIVDVHGEYGGFKSTPEYASKTNVFDGRKVRIGVSRISPQMLREFLPQLSSAQKRDIENILIELKQEKKTKGELFDLDDVIQRVQESDTKETTKASLAATLYSLKSMRLFGRNDSPSVHELAQPGKLSVIDLSEINELRKKQFIVAYFARKLFAARKKERIPPFVLLVEESHNFAKEKASKEDMISKSIIEKIAREGRKFGASIGLISQRPVQLSTTALAQANTHIIMRVTNPNDIKHIGEGCEALDESMLKNITTLRVGEALIVGEALNFPVFVKIRKRKSKKSLKGEQIDVLARRFEELGEKKKNEVEAFL